MQKRRTAKRWLNHRFKWESSHTRSFSPNVNVNSIWGSYNWVGLCKTTWQDAQRPPITHSDHVNKVHNVQFQHYLHRFNLHTEQNVNVFRTKRFSPRNDVIHVVLICHTKHCFVRHCIVWNVNALNFWTLTIPDVFDALSPPSSIQALVPSKQKALMQLKPHAAALASILPIFLEALSRATTIPWSRIRVPMWVVLPPVDIQAEVKSTKYCRSPTSIPLGSQAFHQWVTYTSCPQKSETLNFCFVIFENIAYFDFIR